MPWIEEQDDATRAFLLGGNSPWDDESGNQTVIEGLRDTTWDLAPHRLVVHDVGRGMSEGALRKYLHSPLFQAPPARTQSELMTELEQIRDRLDLSAEVMSGLLGARPRAYHYWVSGEQQLSLPRANTAAGAVAAVAALLSEDPMLAKRIFDTNAEEATELISTGRFASWKALVNRARAEQAREHQALAPALPVAIVMPDGMSAHDFASTVKSAAFRAAAAIMERLAPYTHATEEMWRVTGYAELEEKFQAQADGDELGETWSFLATMSGAGLAEFRERAERVLGDPSTTPAAWAKFIGDESDRAWGSYDFTLRDAVDDAPFGDAEGNLDGLFDFTNLGIDLVTGEPREG
jgi:hypothetical protein